MATKQYTPSRREALATALAFPAVVAVGGVGACATAAKAASGAERRGWDAAFRKMERAKAEAEAYDHESDRIFDAFKAETDKLPHFEIEADGFKLTTANRGHISAAEYFFERRPDAKGEFAEANRKLLDAHRHRLADCQRISDRLGWDEAGTRCDALWDAYTNAAAALFTMAAPDGPAVMWKMGYLFPNDGSGSSDSWPMEWIEQLTADLRRLLNVGRA